MYRQLIEAGSNPALGLYDIHLAQPDWNAVDS